ncbi:hypothetical protein Hte_003184 [Hypoxylon texense]
MEFRNRVSLLGGVNFALGGGSIVNGCAWTRGAKVDYDAWAEVVGDKRWSYKSQLPYFTKTEAWYKKSASHGLDGKLHVESPMSTGRLYPLAAQNRHNGARQLANLACPLDGFTLLTDVLVESVLTDESAGLRATGVRPADGAEHRGKDVILCAGAYRTPQLLMLSGLGPRDVLSRHGIRTKLDVPGASQNFNDHILAVSELGVRAGVVAPAVGRAAVRDGDAGQLRGLDDGAGRQGCGPRWRATGETDPDRHPLLRTSASTAG